MHKTPFSLRRFASACVEAYGAEAVRVVRGGRAPESELSSEITHTFEVTLCNPETYRFTVGEMLSGDFSEARAAEKVHGGFMYTRFGGEVSYADAADDFLESHIVPAIEAEVFTIEPRVVLRAIQVAMMARLRPDHSAPEPGSLAAHIATLPDVLLQLIAETALTSPLRHREELIATFLAKETERRKLDESIDSILQLMREMAEEEDALF